MITAQKARDIANTSKAAKSYEIVYANTQISRAAQESQRQVFFRSGYFNDEQKKYLADQGFSVTFSNSQTIVSW